MVAIIADRSSIGTEASCTAFTEAQSIYQMRERLIGLKIDLENHKQPFWAIASMRRTLGDEKEEAITSSLEIERVERFRRR